MSEQIKTVEYGTVETGSGLRKAKRVTVDGKVEVFVFASASAAKARTSMRRATVKQAETFEVAT